MKFAFALLPIAAALRFVEAGPVAAEDFTKRAPVRVTRLVCDGNTHSCTAFLDWGNGRYFAQWHAHVFHQNYLGYGTEEMMNSMAPVPVTSLTCDRETKKCTATLRFGDGLWAADWDAKVFERGLFGQEVTDAMAPVPVKSLTCDGDGKYHKCTAVLVFGGGAEWDAVVSHNLF